MASEENGPGALIDAAARAEQAGFSQVWISDHYHPWNAAQGQSPFVWTVLGGIARVTSDVTISTAVTCPTVRVHPAIIAQAAATCAVLSNDRFTLGVGSGEALNEHILGARWPDADTRLEMLDEAVEVIRLLWRPGEHSHQGRWYTVENACLYTLPEDPPPVHVSGFGPKAARLAAKIGDGYICMFPSSELVESYRDAGGKGPVQGGLKVCWARDEITAADTAHKLWPTDLLPGELAQILPTPTHFEQASELVTEAMVAERFTLGPDPAVHISAIERYVDAGFDDICVSQIGPDLEGFFRFYEREILPHFAMSDGG